MLVKIGNAYIDPAEVVAMRGVPANELDPAYVEIELRSGSSILIYCEMAEADEIMIEAGMIADPAANPILELEEVDELKHLLGLGFHWIARDGDGKIYAYKDKPLREGISWSAGIAQAPLRLSGTYDFCDAADLEPWAIEALI